MLHKMWVIDLSEHEQERISGSGQLNGQDDCWCILSINQELSAANQELTKKRTIYLNKSGGTF
jgi:hypothetical protein